ncbi:MAG: hypothetical protein QM696_01130 [Steroidobacteraceae bacterium]
MKRRYLQSALFLLAGTAAHGASEPRNTAQDVPADCRPARAIPLQIRFADEAPRAALLRAQGTGLALEDSRSGVRLWSAGPDAGGSQQFSDMRSAFGESLTAVHLDADGVHDRLYAGDRAGRLWRFELQADARPERWLRGGIWADLGLPGGGRGFLAAPDVTLLQVPGLHPWLNVALGSATTGPVPVENRFYFLRDVLAAELPAQPVTEADLLRLSPPGGIMDARRHETPVHGYYLALGNVQVFAPALTLAGRLHFTVVETAQPLAVQCPDNTVPIHPGAVSVTVLRAEDGATADTNGDGQIDSRDLRSSLPRALPADARIDLMPSAEGTAELLCEVGGEALPGCALDTAPHPAGWRREDAD